MKKMQPGKEKWLVSAISTQTFVSLYTFLYKEHSDV
jgi:hypothetical protein